MEALLNFNVIIMIIMSGIIYGKIPGLYESIGIVLGIAGSIVIALYH